MFGEVPRPLFSASVETMTSRSFRARDQNRLTFATKPTQVAGSIPAACEERDHSTTQAAAAADAARCRECGDAAFTVRDGLCSDCRQELALIAVPSRSEDQG
jgi:hypothetical protein